MPPRVDVRVQELVDQRQCLVDQQPTGLHIDEQPTGLPQAHVVFRVERHDAMREIKLPRGDSKPRGITGQGGLLLMPPKAEIAVVW